MLYYIKKYILYLKITLTVYISLWLLSGAAPETAQRQRPSLPAPLPYPAQTAALRRPPRGDAPTGTGETEGGEGEVEGGAGADVCGG